MPLWIGIFLRIAKRYQVLFSAGFIFSCCMPGVGALAASSPLLMKGPPVSAHIHHVEKKVETSPVSIFLGGAIRFYRNVISPTQGDRCGFYPSCSTFGMHAVERYGPLLGVMMTTDRLTRCNFFKEPGSDYFRRPDGRLYDPVTANLIQKQ